MKIRIEIQDTFLFLYLIRMTSMNEFFHYKKNHNEYIHTNFESLDRPSQDQMYIINQIVLIKN